MISRKNLLFSIAILVFLGAPSAHGMHRFSRLKSGAKKFFTRQRVASGFKKTMKTAAFVAFWGNTVAVASAPLWIDHTSHGPSALDDAGPESQKFVKKILQEHGYSEEFIESIVIKRSSSFSALETINKNYMTVPFWDRELDYAQRLYSGEKLDEVQNPGRRDLIGLYMSALGKKSLSKPNARKILEMRGLALSPSALSVWKGSILHEAGHLINNDPFVLLSVNLLCAAYFSHWGIGCIGKLFTKIPSVVKIGKKLGQAGVHTVKGISAGLALWPKLKIRDLGQIPYGKFCEYRADQEVIKRSTDSQILVALGDVFKICDEIGLVVVANDQPRLGKLVKRFPQLLELFDVHPRGSVRAAYLEKAAQKCKKDAVKCKALN